MIKVQGISRLVKRLGLQAFRTLKVADFQGCCSARKGNATRCCLADAEELLYGEGVE
jgi:hypothetical protein